MIARYTGVRPCDRYPGRLDRVVFKQPTESALRDVWVRGVGPDWRPPSDSPAGQNAPRRQGQDSNTLARMCLGATWESVAQNYYCESRSIVALRSAFPRLRNEDTNVVQKASFRRGANSEQPHSARSFQDRHVLNGRHIVPATQAGLWYLDIIARLGFCSAHYLQAASQ